MKKILIVLGIAIAFASCRKYPDYDTLTYKAVVITNHDANAVFSDYKTFYLPPFVGEIGDDPQDSLVDSDVGDPVLNAIASNMESRGYTRTTNKLDADIGIGVASITVTTVESFYPGYWYGYGWYGGYYPYYPYYPYSYTYVYQTGSLVIDFVDIKNADLINQKANIIWTNFNTGVLGATSTTVLAVDAVNQAFRQSLYIQTN